MHSKLCARPEVTKEVVLQRCKYYMDVQLWPLHGKIMPELWLSNFNKKELPFAVQLLSFFLFMSEDIIDSLMVAAFQRLSRQTVRGAATFDEGVRLWEDFASSAIISWIPGERPNFADSGVMFVRKARQVLGVHEANIMAPDQVIQTILSGSKRPVIFFDDFVGSGEQCKTAWEREYSQFGDVSFKTLANLFGNSFFYCPLVCTQYGYERISRHCAGLSLNPTHILGKNYNVLSPDSELWPDSMKSEVYEVIKGASLRAGLPDTNGHLVNDWQGFYCLGLALGFWNGIPDASLPIFYTEENDWKPLMRRK